MRTRLEGTLDLQGFKPVAWLLDLPSQGGNHELGVLLAHGAGGDASSGNLPAFAAACAEAGTPCLRFTARGGSLQHRIKVAKALLAAAPSLPGLRHVQRWVLAGHSMGARVAASLAGEQPPAVPVAACLLLSFPLHPPAKPGELRDGLLNQLRVPTLLVRGSSDPFSCQHWDAALAGMDPACAWQQHTVEGGDHGLKVGGKDGAARSAAALASACAAVQQFVRQAAQGGQGAEASGQQPQQQEERRQQQQGVAAGSSNSSRGRRKRAAAKATALAAPAQAPAARATKRKPAAEAAEAATKSKQVGRSQRRW